jgi:cellulose synthase/poly-beta-1,6-N-acetylglucosamine synthase-like glycosyltransferase
MKPLNQFFRRVAPPLPTVSVIIPAHNEEEFLPATLDALKNQTYPHFETIVVTNGCTDNIQPERCGVCRTGRRLPTS